MSSIEINALLYLVVYWLLTLFLCILCIRYAIIQELAGLGATVHTSARNEAQIVERLQEWEDKRFKVTGSVCDLTFKAQRENFIKTVSSIFNGKLNILVNNAATTTLRGATDYTLKDFSSLMSTNVESPTMFANLHILC
nr:tropinone reductase homolog At2g29150-like [Malus domestica]